MLRGAGMDYEQIKDNLIQICEKRCLDHGADYVDMCETKARQACKYPVSPAPAIPVLGGGTKVEDAKDAPTGVLSSVTSPRWNKGRSPWLLRECSKKEPASWVRPPATVRPW